MMSTSAGCGGGGGYDHSGGCLDCLGDSGESGNGVVVVRSLVSWCWHMLIRKIPRCNGIYYYRYYLLPWRRNGGTTVPGTLQYWSNEPRHPSLSSARELINSLVPWTIAEPHPERNGASTKHTIERTTNVQSFGSGNFDCGSATSSHNNLTFITLSHIDNEDNRIKKWLSPLQP